MKIDPHLLAAIVVACAYVLVLLWLSFAGSRRYVRAPDAVPYFSALREPYPLLTKIQIFFAGVLFWPFLDGPCVLLGHTPEEWSTKDGGALFCERCVARIVDRARACP